MKKHVQHIILISIDTLRADCINASPRAKGYLEKYHTDVSLKTDALDALLHSGLYFNNCYSAAPYTSASHAAYFTGRWPLKNGIYEFFNRKIIKPTIFEYAKEQGYKTIFQTDFPIILGKSLGFTKGIDHYFIEDEHRAFRELEDSIQRNTISFFHFAGVHYPYGFHTLKFGGNDYKTKVLSLEKEFDLVREEIQIPNDVLDETFRSREDTELLLRYKYIIEHLYKKELYNKLFSLYLEGINYFLEHRFNQFIEKVKNFVDKNNAILFLFADHGEEWDGFSEGHHNTLADSVLNVPLLVYGKSINPKIENHLARTIDLAPTIATLFPQPIRARMDGYKLNLDQSNDYEYKTNFAISQVWTSIATKKQIADYQRVSLDTSARVKPLNTFLSGETIRTLDRKYVCYYQRDGSLLREEIVGDVGNLQERLADYNTMRVTKKSALSSIEASIRDELKNLGYNV